MEDLAVREAGAACIAGLHSLENLIGLLSTHSRRQPSYSGSTSDASFSADYVAVADIAVTKFKKFISLLDRTSTGHARFRRGPVSNPAVKPQNKPTLPPAFFPAVALAVAPVVAMEPAVQQRMATIPLVKSGSFDRKDVSAATINFARAASPATSFLSSLTGDTEGVQPSMSSGFQITNLSQVFSAGQPNLSSSFKRKCNSMEDSHTKCTGSSGRCHCSKKRYGF
ncbi:hypothetical protein L1987_53417 [Smallanthus sonchifolius]|uniref:Uncharacterized protein n=1 Tax=Smallanthus sonchifolius TaxID=185202 RepID=A0ACB9EX27_9ASTR|nr:hypothetical protein L1987_53417 [Smallanthus sonchifolius]